MSNFPDVPTRRGRRDPELAAMLDAGRLEQDDQDVEAPSEVEYSLMPGDSVMAKTTLAYRTPMGDAWSTFGAQTHVMQGEDDEDAFERVAGIVNAGVIALGTDAVERVTEIQSNQPTTRITPRG
jgi:hypothetical protein